MQGHFKQVDLIQEAVIRGDLEAAKTEAKALADEPAMAGAKGEAATQEAAMKAAAKGVATMTDLRPVANAVSSMAAACGGCHRASKVTPSLPEPPAAQGEGLAGHMLDHQRAADYLYQGLIVPSDALWTKGVDLLRTSPLMKEKFPEDPQLTDKIASFEGRVHTIADRGKRAKDAKARATLYGEFISSCAECHGLHGHAWGPGLPKQ